MEETINFRVICPLCEETSVITVTEEEYARWKDGTLIQNAMPNLTQGQREQLKSGICPKCWDTAWPVEQ